MIQTLRGLCLTCLTLNLIVHIKTMWFIIFSTKHWTCKTSLHLKRCLAKVKTKTLQVCLNQFYSNSQLFIVCVGVSTPPTLFLAKPPLNRQTFQALLFRHPPPPSILTFRDLSPKSQIFQGTSKILKFFILNTILLLKVTKFLRKISQFEFLVMTEKNIFADKLFFH